MVVESFEDGEGELLCRVRAVTGPDMPLVVSLDLRANITNAMLYDPQVAALAHQSGIGQQLKVRLGVKSGFAGVLPYHCTVDVDALGDGRFTCTGEMYRNIEAQLGPMALLRIIDAGSDVRVIVNSERAQCVDLAMLRHLGVEPTEQRILAIKSAVHFRADFDPIAAETLLVCAPGALSCKLEEVPYRNLRPGIRVAPMAPAT